MGQYWGKILIVRLINKEEVEGNLDEISDQGITLRISNRNRPRQSNSRLIRFDEIQSICRRPHDEPSGAFFALGIFYGLLGPLGWLGTLAMVTGAD